MRNKLIHFVDGREVVYKYGVPAMLDVSATTKFNKWLEEHNNIEVLNWQTTAVGESNCLCIVVEYKDKEDFA